MSELAFYPVEYRSDSNEWPYHISSGGVVYRVNLRKVEVLLLKRQIGRGFSYHLPKGTVMIDESLEAAALREVAEEAGIRGEIIGYLGAVSKNSYQSTVVGSKTIHYFAIRFIEPLKNNDGSYDGAVWMDAQRAIYNLSRIKRKREDVLVERMISLIKLIKEKRAST
jgi:8-oxo-dGTP pyrophosphatase MutT (NUDIX family)